MNLEKLKTEIPFKWRVQSANQYGASCVAYIDARDCQDILDQVCGQENWQTIYYESSGLLFCKVGIKIEEDEINQIIMNGTTIHKADQCTGSSI